ncbi:hypothetical protein [Neisseria meningitidis]|uniref:hypothetical protein n=1 Tax=Neisseria meningitidis TaxID=487 RepID=UPI001C570EBD|nr:hypothetical protein [Neisseria meningitidis]
MADCLGRIGIGSGGVFSGFGSKQGRHSALIWCFIYWGKTDSQKYSGLTKIRTRRRSRRQYK